MANGYQHRIEALEERWKPSPTPIVHVVYVEPSETEEEAAERYAATRGVAVADVLSSQHVIFVRYVSPKERARLSGTPR